MATYKQLVADRHQRRIEIAARRLPKFYDEVERLLREEETSQRRYERFATVTHLIARKPEISSLPMMHQLDIDEWDGKTLEEGVLPALNICAVVDNRWITQYFLVRDPFFPKRMHYVYMHLVKRSEQESEKLMPYMASNYVAGNHHPKIVIQSLIQLCKDIPKSCQTNDPTAFT